MSNQTRPSHEHEHERKPSGRVNWVLLGFLAIAAFFLLSEHRAHALGLLPFALLLLCPLMHVFMHGGHGGGHGAGKGGSEDKQQ